MPIRWSIDHNLRLIRIQVTGEPTDKDYDGLLAEVRAAGGAGYRSIALFHAASDIRGSYISVLAEDVAAKVNPDVSTGQMALIVTTDAGREMAEYFIRRLRGRRPCAAFDTVAEALIWLGLPPDTPVRPD